VEVHLSDVNSRKFGTHDKICLIEARPAGHRPLTARNGASTVGEAVRGALMKLRSSLQPPSAVWERGPRIRLSMRSTADRERDRLPRTHHPRVPPSTELATRRPRARRDHRLRQEKALPMKALATDATPRKKGSTRRGESPGRPGDEPAAVNNATVVCLSGSDAGLTNVPRRRGESPRLRLEATHNKN
jgi:hypothetical protein